MIELAPGEANCSMCRRWSACPDKTQRLKMQNVDRHDCFFFKHITAKQVARRREDIAAFDGIQTSLF